MNKKGNILVILLIGTVIVLSLGTAGYLFLQNKQLQSQIAKPVLPTPVSTPTPIIDPMANWKIYNDNTYKFTLKLPQDWNIIPGSIEPKPKDIYVAYNSDTVDSYIERNPAKMNQSELSRIIINGISVVRIKNNIDTYRREYVILPLTNGTLILGATLSRDSSEATIFDQILSTFKFL